MQSLNQMIQVPRKALMKLLDSHSNKKLLYIHAPAGYGKTVSAQLWLKHRQTYNNKHAIITLDEYDNNTAGFCKRFINALLLL